MPLPKNNLFFGFAKKLSDEQKEYVDAIFDNRLVIVNAKAGSGKTTLAVACAKLLGKDLAYIFTPVSEEILGYRPGSQEDKEKPYTIPLLDALTEIGENPMQAVYSEELLINANGSYKKDAKKLMENFWVYPMSHTFARGTNIKGKTVIIDEAQNFTRSELKKVLTRISDDCHVIVIGHSEQCDLEKPEKSGFIPYINHFASQPYCKICKLTKNFRGELAAWADQLKW